MLYSTCTLVLWCGYTTDRYEDEQKVGSVTLSLSYQHCTNKKLFQQKYKIITKTLSLVLNIPTRQLRAAKSRWMQFLDSR